MAGSTRIKGTKLMFKVGAAAAAKDFWADVTAYELNNDEADSDVTTFADAADGGARQFKLKISGIQSLEGTSLWRYIWDNTGLDVPIVLAPFGNTAPSVAQPHFALTATVPPKPKLGGEAGPGAFTFDAEWLVLNAPTIVTA